MSFDEEGPLLALDNVHVSYDRMAVLKGISLNLRRGEVVCILGPNGAGKSTTLAAIAGGVLPNRGSIRFDGIELVGQPPEGIVRLGLALVPEGRHVFATLTVEENLQVGTLSRRDRGASRQDIERMLYLFPALRERRRALGGMLSGGEQQMLVIARALLTQPRLLMVDEPSLGLAPKIVDQVYSTLMTMRASEGLTLLINEQSSHRVLKYADRIYVVRDGHIKLEGSAADLSNGEGIKSAYFGFQPGRAKVGAIV
jgi:branched-chain amino acid transport system ATP-binding protein